MKSRILAAAALLSTFFALTPVQAADGAPPVIMTVTTNAFEDGDIIPLKYTSHGDNIQPNFTIDGAPASA